MPAKKFKSGQLVKIKITYELSSDIVEQAYPNGNPPNVPWKWISGRIVEERDSEERYKVELLTAPWRGLGWGPARKFNNVHAANMQRLGDGKDAWKYSNALDDFPMEEPHA